MDEEILSKYKKAGSINAEVRQKILKIIKPGMSLLELANFIEEEIRKRGAEPAFPVNISVNELAAHYTPSKFDTKVINEGDLVKIDIGVHIDGYIGDSAFTYCSEKNDLIKCSEAAVKEAIKIIKSGITIGEIGKKIEETVKNMGFGLVLNLTGHTLDRFQFHGSPSIPNFFDPKSPDSNHAFKEWDVIALEPFVTQSTGYIKDTGIIEIYRYLQHRPVRLTEARMILDMAKNKYHSLPFAKRWLYKEISPVKVSLALRQLEAVYALESYPVLRETQNRKIAQSEHTIIVKDKPIVTTEIED